MMRLSITLGLVLCVAGSAVAHPHPCDCSKKPAAKVRPQKGATSKTNATPSADKLVAVYQQVGVAIRELGPRGDDLWPKYRVINIVRVIENPESRQEAVRSLDAIPVQISHIRTAAPSK